MNSYPHFPKVRKVPMSYQRQYSILRKLPMIYQAQFPHFRILPTILEWQYYISYIVIFIKIYCYFCLEIT